MKERKYVKFRVDMFEDTKFKIIDLKPERDMLHYMWTRFVLLAGKVNLDGDLYMSKLIPYTIETLAIEVNRTVEQVRLALEVFEELKMVELTKDKVYRVINFVKHQGINVREKTKSREEKVTSVQIDKENLNNQKNNIRSETSSVRNIDKEIKLEKEIKQKGIEAIENVSVSNLDVAKNDGTDNDLSIIQSINSGSSNKNRHMDNDSSFININTNRSSKVNDAMPIRDNQENSKSICQPISNHTGANDVLMPINLENKKSRRRKKEAIYEISAEEAKDEEPMCKISDGEFTLGEGEELVTSWEF